jgi:hypothetical protein
LLIGNPKRTSIRADIRDLKAPGLATFIGRDGNIVEGQHVRSKQFSIEDVSFGVVGDGEQSISKSTREQGVRNERVEKNLYLYGLLDAWDDRR